MTTSVADGALPRHRQMPSTGHRRMSSRRGGPDLFGPSRPSAGYDDHPPARRPLLSRRGHRDRLRRLLPPRASHRPMPPRRRPSRAPRTASFPRSREPIPTSRASCTSIPVPAGRPWSPRSRASSTSIRSASGDGAAARRPCHTTAGGPRGRHVAASAVGVAVRGFDRVVGQLVSPVPEQLAAVVVGSYLTLPTDLAKPWAAALANVLPAPLGGVPDEDSSVPGQGVASTRGIPPMTR